MRTLRSPWLFAFLTAVWMIGCSADSGSSSDGPVGTRPDAGGETDTGAMTDTGEATTDTGGETTTDTGTTTTDTGTTTTDTGTATDTGSSPDVPPSRGGLLVADPATVNFSYFTGDTALDQAVVLTNRGDGAMDLVSIELDPTSHAGFLVYDNPPNVHLEPEESLTIMVRYNVGADSFADGFVNVNIAGETTPFQVPLVATHKGDGDPGCVEVSPRNINFGNVIRDGSTAPERTFEIRNCGDSEITIAQLARGRAGLFGTTPNNFTWEPQFGPINIPAGGSETATVTFTPGRVGLYSGQIDVLTNVEGSESLPVTLSANAERPEITDLDLHILLEWDVDGGSDVDLHFLPVGAEPGSSDACYFGNMEPDWGVAGDYTDNPFLDVDDLEGPGPENINVDELVPGQYLIHVHYYSDTGSGAGGDSDFGVSTNATVQVFIHGTLAGEYGPHYLGSTGDRWDVAVVDWPSGTLSAP